MRILKYIVTIIAIVLLSCQPENLPKTPDGNGNPDVENPDDTEDPDNPGTNDPEQPQESYYVKVAQDFSDWSGDYLITYTTAISIKVFDSFSDSSKGGSKTDLNS